MAQIVNKSVIKIIGLLGDFSSKGLEDYEKSLQSAGFIEEAHPMKEHQGNWVMDADSEKTLKDLFYPDFRNIMFFDSKAEAGESSALSKRYFSVFERKIEFLRKDFSGAIKSTHRALVKKAEIFLFPGQIGLFSITIVPEDSSLSLQAVNDLIFLCRQFDVDLSSNIKFHDWISREILCGRALRGNDVKSDEYSGSKFKVFSLIDCDEPQQTMESLLFEMATVTPVGTVKSGGSNAPQPGYYQNVMGEKISVFRDWEAICLFDSFTAVGNGFIKQDYQSKTWEYTYFRIYLFLLFFKFNLYRYNTDLHENTLKLRSQFETFLNNYFITHISFNFLPNLIYANMREALSINEEVTAFQNRISRISVAIQEKRQTITNFLLQLVTLLGAISSIDPAVQAIQWLKDKTGCPPVIFYTSLSFVLIVLLLVSLALMFPEKRRKLMIKVKRCFR